MIRKNILPVLFYTGFFIILVFSIIIKSSYSYGMLILLIVSTIIIMKKDSITLSRTEKIFFAIIALYAIILIPLNIIHGDSGSLYEYPLRLLLFLPLFFSFRYFQTPVNIFFLVIAIAISIASIMVSWDGLVRNQLRPSNGLNPIFYGEISLLYSIILVIGLMHLADKPSSRGKLALVVFFVLAISLGILGTILSGSRGSWVAVPVAFSILFIFARKQSKKWLLLIVTMLGVIFTISYFIPQTNLANRITLAKHDISEFYNQNFSTSLGLRLGLWQNSHFFFTEKPLLGWGEQGFLDEKARLIQQGTIDPALSHIGHLHNQYLEVLVKQGAIALFLLLMFLYVPLHYFIKSILSRNDAEARHIALLGIITVCSFAIYGLTDILLQFNVGLTLYFIIVIYCISYLVKSRAQ